MADLLLEILSEEIPARMQKQASNDLERLLCTKLKEANITFDEVQNFSASRRLAIHISGLPLKQEDRHEEKRGPQIDAPEQALMGFMKANNLSDITQAEQREIKGKTYYFATTEVKGQEVSTFLQKELVDILAKFPWQKSMRFLEEGNNTKWVRPIRNILCLFDGQVLDFEFGGVKANNQTFGHRFMHPEPLEVHDVQSYEQGLFEAMVITNRNTRKTSIIKALDDICEANNLTLNKDEALLEEVTGLVEWPHIILGDIDTEFMELPPEVLVDTLRDHQKYFTLSDAKGKLSPHFITISNMVTMEPEIIRAGNERVLRARLYDAKFFWDQDRKQTLQSRLDGLKSMLFQAELGSQYDRSIRISQLGKTYAPLLKADETKVERAGLLAKADLVTGMVFEIPEVQGVMGHYYALNDGEDAQVALAIEEHYKPAGSHDDVPQNPISVALALADKFDALVGFWAIGKKPTGSGDPFALRRAALGIIRLLLYHQQMTPLTQFIEEAIKNWQKSGLLTAEQLKSVPDELLEFFAERMRVSLKDEGFNAHIGNSLLGANAHKASHSFTPWLINERAKALQSFLETDDGVNMLAGLKRAGNIVTAEEKKDKTSYKGAIKADILSDKAEKSLFEALNDAQKQIKPALAEHNYTKAMGEVAKLRLPIDSFLDNVMVNVDDNNIRINRLHLLAHISESLNDVADFSALI
ncbi:MAG: glycine--tRNA ligase subunit beta [Alphaproteobacteria bacterium]